jgi:acetyltransferase-like isoleucine patch superfamily enzyme
MELIIRIATALASRLRATFYRTLGMRIEGRCWLRAIEVPREHRSILLKDGVALDRGVTLIVTGKMRTRPKITIGEKTYVNRHAILDASDEIDIGAQCMIGPHCYITDHDHAFTADRAPSEGELKSEPTRIEDRCWLGAHVTVLKGVTIGAGTVVGAGSVVTKSLPAGVLAVGNPARVLKKIEP